MFDPASEDPNLSSEAHLVAAMLGNRDADTMAKITSYFTADDFFVPVYAGLYLAIKECFEKGKPYGFIGVKNHLEKQGDTDLVTVEQGVTRLIELAGIGEDQFLIHHAHAVASESYRRQYRAMIDRLSYAIDHRPEAQLFDPILLQEGTAQRALWRRYQKFIGAASTD